MVITVTFLIDWLQMKNPIQGQMLMITRLGRAKAESIKNGEITGKGPKNDGGRRITLKGNYIKSLAGAVLEVGR